MTTKCKNKVWSHWSIGTPTPCQASNLYRKEEKIEFYDDTLGFSLTDENFAQEFPDLMVDATSRELYFDNNDALETNVSLIFLKHLPNLIFRRPKMFTRGIRDVVYFILNSYDSVNRLKKVQKLLRRPCMVHICLPVS